MSEVKRPGCFVGEKEKMEALCQMPDCRFAGECIWKMEKVPSHLGEEPEKRGKILNDR